MANFEKLSTEHRPAVVELLKNNLLPFEDLDFSTHYMLGKFNNHALEAMAALEIYHPYALLRSVSVKKDCQGLGLGSQLIRKIMEDARIQGISKLYLLTETAEKFFTHHGFMKTDRKNVPEAIKKSPEFQHICPASATCMSYDLEKK